MLIVHPGRIARDAQAAGRSVSRSESAPARTGSRPASRSARRRRPEYCDIFPGEAHAFVAAVRQPDAEQLIQGFGKLGAADHAPVTGVQAAFHGLESDALIRRIGRIKRRAVRHDDAGVIAALFREFGVVPTDAHG